MCRVTGGASSSDGVEEVFAAVGESVSLSCHNTSSLGVGGSVEWAVGGRTVNKGPSSLVIGKVSAQHAGDYECSESAGRQKVFNRIRLQTLEGECDQNPTCPPFTFTHSLSCLSVQLHQSQRAITSP